MLISVILDRPGIAGRRDGASLEVVVEIVPNPLSGLLKAFKGDHFSARGRQGGNAGSCITQQKATTPQRLKETTVYPLVFAPVHVIEDDSRSIKGLRLTLASNHLTPVVPPQRRLRPRARLAIKREGNSPLEYLQQLLEETNPVGVERAGNHHVDIRFLLMTGL